MLAEAPTIDEQADILHFLVLCYGPKHKLHVTKLDQVSGFTEFLSLKKIIKHMK